MILQVIFENWEEDEPCVFIWLLGETLDHSAAVEWVFVLCASLLFHTVKDEVDIILFFVLGFK